MPGARLVRVHDGHNLARVNRGVVLTDAVEWVPLSEVAGRLAYADERQLLANLPPSLLERA